MVLYSHGLRSLPALHAALTSRWAAAGFVVVAPAYPRTNQRARPFTREDVRNQPADAWRLIRHLVRLGARPGDPLGAHLAVDRFAAAGHSAGGHTTLGMFASGQSSRARRDRDRRWPHGRRPSRPLAPMLFVHGSADRIVPESIGRAAYARCLGPAAFLSLTGQGHGEYLTPGRPGFPRCSTPPPTSCAGRSTPTAPPAAPPPPTRPRRTPPPSPPAPSPPDASYLPSPFVPSIMKLTASAVRFVAANFMIDGVCGR
ncbi:hypothetical protein V2I01_07310 [Micromonospora sp. BRA006-A]|nr:hypothetical protein [Micromonospora sp. BRA006-A]